MYKRIMTAALAMILLLSLFPLSASADKFKDSKKKAFFNDVTMMEEESNNTLNDADVLELGTWMGGTAGGDDSRTDGTAVDYFYIQMVYGSIYWVEIVTDKNVDQLSWNTQAYRDGELLRTWKSETNRGNIHQYTAMWNDNTDFFMAFEYSGEGEVFYKLRVSVAETSRMDKDGWFDFVNGKSCLLGSDLSDETYYHMLTVLGDDMTIGFFYAYGNNNNLVIRLSEYPFYGDAEEFINSSYKDAIASSGEDLSSFQINKKDKYSYTINYEAVMGIFREYQYCVYSNNVVYRISCEYLTESKDYCEPIMQKILVSFKSTSLKQALPTSTPTPTPTPKPVEPLKRIKFEGSLADYKRVKFSSASASSELSSGGIRFKAGYAIDDTSSDGKKRPWIEGRSSDGVGETLTLKFKNKETIQLLAFDLGYARDKERYWKNSRPKKLRLTFSDGSKIECNFYDKFQTQYVCLNHPVETTSVEIKILEVYTKSTEDGINYYYDKDTGIFLVRAYK